MTRRLYSGTGKRILATATWGQPPRLSSRAQLDSLLTLVNCGTLLRWTAEGGCPDVVTKKMLILETEPGFFCQFVPEDVDALAAVLSDPETMRYYPAVLDRAGVAAWIDRNRRRYADAGHGLWAMILKSNGEVTGWFGPPDRGRRGRNRNRISRPAQSVGAG